MNLSIQIAPSNGSNSSGYLFNIDTFFSYNSLYLLNLLLGLPTYSYVIWLIVAGTRNGLAAEFFTLNLCICEIFLCLEFLCLFLVSKFLILWNLVSFLEGFAMTGRPLFECLMCVERYLAVVHPLTFLKYKPLRYRVISSVLAWVATCFFSVILVIYVKFLFWLYFVFLFVQFFLYFFIQLFCLVAVLRALKQSGPGDKKKEEENQMKRRAFDLILITSLTTLVIYAPYIILMSFLHSSNTPGLILSAAAVFFAFAGLVQPLFFLYRVKKLPFIK